MSVSTNHAAGDDLAMIAFQQSVRNSEFKSTWLDANKPRVRALRASSSEPSELHKLVWHQLGHDHHFQPKPNTTWQNYVGYALREIITRALHQLCNVAERGDGASIKALAEIAIKSTQALSMARQNHLEKVIPMARAHVAWPVMKSKCFRFDDSHSPLSRGDKKLLDELQAGLDNPIQASRWGMRHDFLSILLSRFMEDIESCFANPFPVVAPWQVEARRLRNTLLSKKTVEKWWPVVELYLKSHYPSNTKLVETWKRFGKRIPKSKAAKTRREIGTTLGTEASYIRGQLKKKFREMLGEYVKHATPILKSNAFSKSDPRAVKDAGLNLDADECFKKVCENNPNGFFSSVPDI